MIGQTISHYRILEKIGEGGMGVVYKAEDTKLHRPVAVKFLPLEKSASKDQTNRFVREAQAAANLSHPNIATVFELNDVEDPVTHTTHAFIAMEYVEGQTLEEIIRQGPIPIDRVRNVAVQISRGLLSAHERGTIHRDIKPSNIIVNKDDVAKLLDFGLAKLLQDPTVSGQSKIVGSVAYMSPEQTRGENLDIRTDLWSFGVLLYQLLSGRLPFRGDHTPAMMYSIINEDPTPVRTLRPDTPDDLALACERCLQKDPEQRPRDANEILQILEAGTRTTHAVQPRRWVRLIAARPALSWIVIFILIIASSILLWQPFSSPTSQKEALSKNWRIGVLQFENLTKNPETIDWPPIIQAMMTQELSGVEYFGVVDPSRLNNIAHQSTDLYQALLSDSIQSVIRGKILSAEFGFRIQTYLIDVKSGEVRRTFPETGVRNDEELGEAARSFAEQIRHYYEITIQEMGKDEPVRAWHSSRSQNVDAVRAFLQAYHLIMREMEGVEEKLLRAIELDSTFISPRIWLVSRLTRDNKFEDAQAQFAALQRLEPNANPFEQAMIGWAAARLAKDLPEQEKFLQLALVYRPGNDILIINLASNYYRQHYYEETLAALKPLLAGRWEYPPIYALAGDCLIQTGHFAESKALLKGSLNVTPVVPQVYSMLAALSAREDKPADVTLYEKLFFKRCREQKMHFSRAYEDLVRKFIGVGQNDKARQYFVQSLQFDSTSAEAEELREFMKPYIH